MEKMHFPCNACGACCCNVKGVKSLDRGDGICFHFDTESKLCLTYDSRPLACNVDKIYNEYYKGTISPKAYYMTQASSCVDLLPQNADMPQRTAEALREAGLYDECEIDDVEKIKYLIFQKLTLADFNLTQISEKSRPE